MEGGLSPLNLLLYLFRLVVLLHIYRWRVALNLEPSSVNFAQYSHCCQISVGFEYGKSVPYLVKWSFSSFPFDFSFNGAWAGYTQMNGSVHKTWAGYTQMNGSVYKTWAGYT